MNKVIEVKTGEVLPPEDKLDQIASNILEVLDRHELDRIAYALRLGALLSEARALKTSDKEFGDWMRSVKISDRIDTKTAWNYRVLFERFPNASPEVIRRVGLTSCYALLAAPEEARAEAIEAAEAGGKWTGGEVKALIAKHSPKKEPAQQPKSEDAGGAGDEGTARNRNWKVEYNKLNSKFDKGQAHIKELKAALKEMQGEQRRAEPKAKAALENINSLHQQLERANTALKNREAELAAKDKHLAAFAERAEKLSPGLLKRLSDEGWTTEGHTTPAAKPKATTAKK